MSKCPSCGKEYEVPEGYRILWGFNPPVVLGPDDDVIVGDIEEISACYEVKAILDVDGYGHGTVLVKRR